MAEIYLEYQFTISPLRPGSEILMAQLGAAGFESFVETDSGILAYIQKRGWDEAILKGIGTLTSNEFAIDYSFKEIAPINWNEAWEQNFEPIEVGDTCRVRAPFHPEKSVRYEIVIEPKMSFGTGHHETTFMMLHFLLENDFKHKKVLDMGCGTAVLAILAEMRGAVKIDAVDIDPWCVENSMENTERNGRKNISVILGDASLLKNKKYDTVIANINRNILIEDMHSYKNCLKPGGELYVSGFYKEDLPIITEVGNKLEFLFVENKEKNRWIAAKFVL